jgi:hypothetical protein
LGGTSYGSISPPEDPPLVSAVSLASLVAPPEPLVEVLEPALVDASIDSITIGSVSLPAAGASAW